MSRNRQIYLLDPRRLSPETIAVTFAKTSRSPLSFQEIADELTEVGASRFHEKWVVGYGHSSVAEHAVLHIAVENVSRLAAECLESNRLASYTEKSTRYQTWGEEDFYIPAELTNHLLHDEYVQTCRRLFSTYQQAIPLVRQAAAGEEPQQPDESNADFERRIHCTAVDVCRFILPSASLANLGITINARGLEHALCKMLSHPLEEVRQIGEQIKAASLQSVPTLVKYASPQNNLSAEIPPAFPRLSTPAGKETDWCTLIDFDPQADEKILAAGLYRFSSLPFAACTEEVRTMPSNARTALLNRLLGDSGLHETPLRELEYTGYVFDLVMDQGAYYEFKRHRMMTQTAQTLSCGLGYALPRLISAAGFERNYDEAMNLASEACARLAGFSPHLASYLVPNAFRRRVLAGLNYRAAQHLIRLRTAPNAHFSIRRVAQRLADEIRAANPLLGERLLCGAEETWQSIERAHFTHA